MLRLPLVKRLATGNVLVDLLNRTNKLKEATNLFMKYVASGEGVGVDDWKDEAAVVDVLSTDTTLVVIDQSTDTVMGIHPVRPSPLVRSNHAEYITGYFLMEPRYRGAGRAEDIFPIIQAHHKSLGYCGLIGRTAITARSLVPSRNSGHLFSAVIPNSTRQANGAYVDDFLVFRQYTPFPHHKVPDTMAHLQEEETSLSGLFVPLNFTSHQMSLTSGQEVSIMPASASNVWKIESLLRKCAENGQGYAVNEFTPSGHFNRKLLQNTHLMVAKYGDVIVGAALFGRSAFCRSLTAPCGHVYLAVEEDFKRKGVGLGLVEHTCTVLKEQGFQGVLADVLGPNAAAISLLLKSGFISVGSVPNSAYLKDYGWTDSLIFYKDFMPVSKL